MQNATAPRELHRILVTPDRSGRKGSLEDFGGRFEEPR
jgi:hypothetical protein